MAFCLKRHLLDPSSPAGPIKELFILKLKKAVNFPEVEMPKVARGRIVDILNIPLFESHPFR